ncbi:MAG: ImmA/IrrE family metallo-endopeptidase [Magnetospirillum sp.]|nr:ImmA/IrrE family metallo-endopeptidase [Magnetospirillum sp.]
MTQPAFGPRIKALREAHKLTQDELARQLGFKDRQTISAIETGERRLSADELLQAAKVFKTTVEEMTDPFVLVGDEGRFSWRQTGIAPERLMAFEQGAGQWIATFRRVAPQVGHAAPLFRRTLTLTTRSTDDEARAAGERFAADFALGDVPARRLAEVMDQEFGILVLMVDAIDGVSGAACRLQELDAVLINRREPEGRRHFDLAHELFHILTWEAMPPHHSEAASEISKSHVERLANGFASAVLMPRTVIARAGDWAGMDVGAIVAKLNRMADELAVTASALRWRLADLKIISQAVARQVPEAAIRNNGRPGRARDMPPPFSRRFMEVIASALDDGVLSTRRAAGLLGVTLDDLPELYRAHGIDAAMEL